MTNLPERINSALARVHSPALGTDVLTAEQVRDVAATRDGRVRLTLVLSPTDDAAIVREVRRAVEQVEGVVDVYIEVLDPREVAARARRGEDVGAVGVARAAVRAATGPAAAGSVAPGAGAATAPASGGGARALPVMDQQPQSRRAAVPAPTPVAYPQLGRIIAISSGKGGVGKSTVAANLAVTLVRQGKRVGLMDGDIYGPNIPRMLGVDRQPEVEGNRIIPLEAYGLKVMSLGFLVERDQPAIWRGPIIMKIITQFLRDVDWGELDYFIVDLPPGTGDAQLSLVQATQVHGVLIVTTPQEVATGDALRGAKMFERVGVPVLGIVENMSWYECPHCGEASNLFGSGGGQKLANELGLPLLAQIPLDPRVYEGGDTGLPIPEALPESGPAKALDTIAEKVDVLLADRGASS